MRLSPLYLAISLTLLAGCSASLESSKLPNSAAAMSCAPQQAAMAHAPLSPPPTRMAAPSAAPNTENYAGHEDNPIQRAEEMINYFDYGYPAPATHEIPFRVSTEIATAPWNARHQLLQIGIQGYQVAKSAIPASNIVFLIDTSGSMQSEDKLPLLKQSFRELARQLRPQDRVSMVVYAGSAGLVLPPTAGNEQEAALDRLEAGGSTMLIIAQDVKIQLKFNPAVVAEYRLIGYENRSDRSRARVLSQGERPLAVSE